MFLFNTNSARALLVIVCLCLVLPAAEAEVYRWTDANGQVHFSQRPPPGGAEPMESSDTEPVNTYGDDGLRQRQERERRLLESYEYEREQKKAREAREADARQAAAADCGKLQKYWQRLSFPGPIYIRRDDGGRDYLSDEQRAAQKARIRPAYERACGRSP